jgi:hypothetical protein
MVLQNICCLSGAASTEWSLGQSIVHYSGLGATQLLAFAGSQTKSDIFFFGAPVIFRGIIFQVLTGLKLLAVFPNE